MHWSDLRLLIACAGLFFFKQKTAYALRISDWSSDVCSSDLGVVLQTDEPGPAARGQVPVRQAQREGEERRDDAHDDQIRHSRQQEQKQEQAAIGRASRRERVCQYV